MSHRNTQNKEPLIDLDDWVADSPDDEFDNQIYKRDSMRPEKRRRLEALLEEKRLLRDISDVFSEDDDF